MLYNIEKATLDILWTSRSMRGQWQFMTEQALSKLLDQDSYTLSLLSSSIHNIMGLRAHLNHILAVDDSDSDTDL